MRKREKTQKCYEWWSAENEKSPEKLDTLYKGIGLEKDSNKGENVKFK